MRLIVCQNKECELEFEERRYKQKFCSISCGRQGRTSWNKGISANGPDSNSWKEDWKDLGYWGVHERVRKTWGKACMCQNLGCKGHGKLKFHWANLDGKYNPTHKESWAMLCNPCHRSYDMDRIAIAV